MKANRGCGDENIEGGGGRRDQKRKTSRGERKTE